MNIGEELGELLTQRAVSALGIEAGKAESYGKAAAVGENGELEHAAAVLHPKLGAPVRKVLGKGAALIPSSKKRGGMGVPGGAYHSCVARLKSVSRPVASQATTPSAMVSRTARKKSCSARRAG